MRKPIAAILAGLLSCSSVVAAEPARLFPSAAGTPEQRPVQRPLVVQTLRDEIRIASRDGSLQTDAQQPVPEKKSWPKRHPVWTGLMLGAGAGAVWGAASCNYGNNNCWPVGPVGGAIAGSYWGAGVGALIGFVVGQATK